MKDEELEAREEEESVFANGFKPDGKKLTNAVFEWIETVLVAFCAVALIFTFLCKVVTVEGPSMNYTLYEGQKLIISSVFYTPQRGDVVVIDTPKFSEPIIKRIIAVGGDTVDIDFDNWKTTVTTKDGEIIVYEDEEYVNFVYGTDMSASGYLSYPYTVPEGDVFVMGDNRTHSTDSREKGSFSADDILGKAVFRIWPFDKLGILN